jgi:hypothetical protein
LTVVHKNLKIFKIANRSEQENIVVEDKHGFYIWYPVKNVDSLDFLEQNFKKGKIHNGTQYTLLDKPLETKEKKPIELIGANEGQKIEFSYRKGGENVLSISFIIEDVEKGTLKYDESKVYYFAGYHFELTKDDIDRVKTYLGDNFPFEPKEDSEDEQGSLTEESEDEEREPMKRKKEIEIWDRFYEQEAKKQKVAERKALDDRNKEILKMGPVESRSNYISIIRSHTVPVHHNSIFNGQDHDDYRRKI